MDKAKLIKYGLGLMSLLLGGIIGWSQTDLLPLAQAGQQSTRILIPSEVSSTSALVTPLPLPTSTVTPSTPASSQPTPTIEWANNPVCKNLPQDLAGWLVYAQQALSNPTVVTQLSNNLRQAQLLDPALSNVSFEELLARLTTGDTAETSQVILRELIVVWLNVISGRLNQATELQIPGQPEIKTVGDLIAQLERALVNGDLPASLLEASRQLQAGQNISLDVCSRLIYRTGSVIRESLWSADGYIEHDTPIPDVPVGITSFSPDYTKLIVETSASDTGGGPLYLFDLKTGELINLNQRLGLRDHLGPMGLTVAGWHPDSSHFLLFDQNNETLVWADLKAHGYQRINLHPEKDFRPIRQVALEPGGSSLIYVTGGPNQEVAISRYDLGRQTITPLTSLNLGPDQLQSFRLSPTGEMAAYVIKKGQRQTGVSYALELLNMRTYARTPLLEGHLGHTEPIWSPDGQKIAFVRKTEDAPDVAGAEQGQPWRGNIWVASIASGNIQQITSIQGAAYRPVWSADSRFLAFITHEGEIGLVAVDQPGQIWRLGASLILPQLTSLGFVP